jgi:hypothetical protein
LEGVVSYLKSANGLKAAIPRLRAFSELEDFPPMMSHLNLRWLLGNHLEVDLLYATIKEKYEVKLVNWHDLIRLKQADVGIDEVVNTVWKFIHEVRATGSTNASK